MYNEFIKKITANLSPYLNYISTVEDSDFSIVDNNGEDITYDIKDIIDGNKEGNSELLRDLFSRSTKDTGIATLQYLGKHPEKNSDVIAISPDFADAYLSNINFTLYYIDKVLGNDITKNADFITKFKNVLNKRPDLIPIYMYLTGDIDDSLLDVFIKVYSEESKVVEHLSLIEDFLIALQQHDKLESLYKSGKIRDLVNTFAVNVHHGIDIKDKQKNNNDDDNDQEDNNKQIENVFNLDLSNASPDMRKFFNIINDNGGKTLTNLDSRQDLSIDKIVDNFDKNIISKSIFKQTISENGKLKENIKTIVDAMRNLANGDKFVAFFNALLGKLKIKTASLRGKKMFRLSKAYTRYYIKNVLAYRVKANSDPEVLPQVVKVSTDEIQDLMYGDSVKHPENLSEIQNPAAKEQIFNDVEDAVEKISKGDLLEDGAADGMSIEDLAKKWAPMYNMQYEQMLDTLKTQEQAGSIVEQEHTDNLEIAKEIARDHLAEAPDYYTHLENMETLFPDENVAVKPLMEPENMDLKTVNPIPEDSDHVCDGSCGGNCKCHDKVQTVEDKIQDLSGDGIVVVMVSDSPEVIEEQPLDFIQQIAAKIKR